MEKIVSKLFGPRYVSVAKAWFPTVAYWGVAGAVAVVHFTDWRVVLDYVPYINGKFKKKE